MSSSWSNDLLIGVQIIDSQHREFFARVDSLLAQDLAEGVVADYTQAFAFLRTYVDEHFGTEERLMDRYEFPQARFHKSHHVWFKAEIDRIHGEAVAHGVSVSVQTQMNYLLTDWFRSHIRGVDVKLAAHLKNKTTSLSLA